MIGKEYRLLDNRDNIGTWAEPMVQVLSFLKSISILITNLTNLETFIVIKIIAIVTLMNHEYYNDDRKIKRKI